MPKWGETSSPARKAARARSYANGLKRKLARRKAQEEREARNRELHSSDRPWAIAQQDRASRRANDPNVQARRHKHEVREAEHRARLARALAEKNAEVFGDVADAA